MNSQLWFEPLVWMDYRLAVILAVIMPIAILIWAFVEKSESIQHLLAIYWRVASLLAITIYLMIASSPLSFVSAFLARLLIPISLWFWADINEDINDQLPSPLKLTVTSWRWATTIYHILGAIALIPFLPCAFSAGAINTPFCEVWLKAPWLYKQYFHAGSTPKFLGFLGITALMIYVLYLAYFVLIRLAKQGRSAIEH